MAALLLCASTGTRAGIPVIDASNLVFNEMNFMQFVEQVANQVTQIGHQITQIEHLRATFANMTGKRMLGNLLRYTGMDNYVPLNAIETISNVSTHGISGMTASARALRDAAKFYNCDDLSASTRKVCEAQVAQPYQTKALLNQAMTAANGRLKQIQQLTDAINATDDQAAKLEINARLQAENAMLVHEQTRAQMLAEQVRNDEIVAAVQRHERTAAMLRRTGTIADFMGGGIAP